MLLVGVSLMKEGITGQQAVSQSSLGQVGPFLSGLRLTANLAIAGAVLLSILLIIALFKGFVANIAVLLGLCIGFVIALGMGRVNFDGVAGADWLSRFFRFTSDCQRSICCRP